MMQYLSNQMGFGGKTSNADLHQKSANEPVHVSYDYTRETYADWANLRILPLFPGLELAAVDSDKAPEKPIDLGALRTEIATSRIKLPEGYRAELPEPVHLKRDYTTYDKTYRVDQGELISERTVAVLKKKLPPSQWKDYLDFTKAVANEEYIILLAPSAEGDLKRAKTLGAKSSGAAKANGHAEDAGSPAALIQQALASESRGDWDSARRKLDQVKALAPETPYLMSMYGYVEAHDRRMDLAEADIRAELARQPSAVDVAVMLASLYASEQQEEKAVALIKTYLAREGNSTDLRLLSPLADLQARQKDYAGSIATTQIALAANPENRMIQTKLAETLHLAHRDTEAAAAAKVAMDGSSDPNILNSNAYLLAEMEVDLDMAEKKSRYAVALLEEASAQGSVQEANDAAFAQTTLLAASWDTLGWILCREKKAAQAVPYLWAAWISQPRTVVGNHLAQTLEAAGKSSEALTIAILALAAERSDGQPAATAELTSSIERLRKAGTESAAAGHAAQMLQAMRTFTVKKDGDLSGWGTFRVQIGSEGVRESELVQGDPKLRRVSSHLKALSMPGAVPADSKAHILRDGVLSCSVSASTCEFVLMPRSGLAFEGVE